MRPRGPFPLPEEQQKLVGKARRLEWVTIFFMVTITALMFFTMGSSQAMKTAWIEDVLSLIPPVAFLLASHKREKEPNERFPYGYERAFALSFLAAAFALLMLGLYMAYDAAMGLLSQHHPTITHREILGLRVWSGWFMIAALVYSVIPPVVLGRMKLPVAKKLDEKTLKADADMNKADWMTGAAAVAGVLGIGMGLWWADSAAALIISLDVVKDGFTNVKRVFADLADQHPTDVEGKFEKDLMDRARDRLRSLDWVEDADVRLRDEGLPLAGEAFLQVRGDSVTLDQLSRATVTLHDLDWRFHDVVVTAVADLDVQRRPQRGVR